MAVSLKKDLQDGPAIKMKSHHRRNKNCFALIIHFIGDGFIAHRIDAEYGDPDLFIGRLPLRSVCGNRYASSITGSN